MTFEGHRRDAPVQHLQTNNATRQQQVDLMPYRPTASARLMSVRATPEAPKVDA